MIERDEIWRAADSPHLVEGPLAVIGGATLTIEPCAVVRFAPGAGVEVGLPDGAELGRLEARGEAARPIALEGTSAAPWSGIVVHAPSRVDLAHVGIDGGGQGPGGATLVGVGAGVTPAAEVLWVDTVTVARSAGAGVRLDRAARFGDGSRALAIDGASGAALVVGLHGLQGLPDGAYAGNARDEIVIDEDEANDRPGLQADTALRDLGVPYVVGQAVGDHLRVGANGGPAVTLTIEAGVELRFQPEGSLRMVADADGPRGTLRVRGTAARPVTFTSRTDADPPGSWAGLYFESPMADHDVAFARVERAGGFCSCSLATCSPVTTFDGAVILDGLPARVFVHDSVIVDSAGHGFVRSWLDHDDLDFAAANQLQGVAACAQTRPQLSDVVCPDEAYACAP
ncbi:MAG: hypothetical protein IPL61_35105 [Myxococcales bacterium]|nr:hypothetical protein [Myxococcales bacterium]